MDSIKPAGYSSTFAAALAYTAFVHQDHVRKGGENIPYVGHLLGVASIVIDATGTEDEAIAALLHDAPEDRGGKKRLNDIRAKFGDKVADIVEACSDSLEEDEKDKAAWRARKEQYIAHLRDSNNKSAFLVSAADKLHNMRSILADYLEIKDELWGRFDKEAGMDGTIWYYSALVEAYESGPHDARRNKIVVLLQSTLKAVNHAIESQSTK